MKRLVLLIDDNVTFIENFRLYTANDYEVISAATGQEGLTLMQMERPDVVLLDLKLGDGENGLDVLKKLKQIDTTLPVIIVTEFPDHETAVEAFQLGAAYYTSKAPNLETLQAVIDQQLRALPWRKLYSEHEKQQFGTFIGESPVIKDILEKVERLAQTDYPVLIRGETGTGKEIIARRIHNLSKRNNLPLLTVNCSAVVGTIFESEFFGHVKGSFTSAISNQKGKFEQAEQSTLFLDEIGELPIESQPKLLEAIEYKRFTPVGGEQVKHADVRIIAATNRDLQKMIKEGTFREDLYYRLNVFELYIPPLHERPEDIPPLARYLLTDICQEMNVPIPEIHPKAIEYWQGCQWRGNVRGLHNHISNIIVNNPGLKMIKREHVEGLVVRKNARPMFYSELLGKKPYPKVKKELLDYFQFDYISKWLAENDYNISKTADELGIHRSTVHRIYKKLMERRRNNKNGSE